jgi:hypothetical protein
VVDYVDLLDQAPEAARPVRRNTLPDAIHEIRSEATKSLTAFFCSDAVSRIVALALPTA